MCWWSRDDDDDEVHVYCKSICIGRFRFISPLLLCPFPRQSCGACLRSCFVLRLVCPTPLGVNSPWLYLLVFKMKLNWICPWLKGLVWAESRLLCAMQGWSWMEKLFSLTHFSLGIIRVCWFHAHLRHCIVSHYQPSLWSSFENPQCFLTAIHYYF